MNLIAKLFLAVILITEVVRSAAFAQAQTEDPNACADTAHGSSNQTLSEKLDRSNGVICPPNVDPGIKAPTPSTGTMPIIRPPGSPGGNPDVQPK